MPGIDISANTQSAQAALKQLEQAFKDLLKTGKQFTDIDLNTIGAGPLNDDLKKILENWRRMTQDKGKRGEALRREGQDQKAPWEVDPRKAYPNATEAEIKKFTQQLLDGLLHGISGINPELPRRPERPDIPNLPNRPPKPPASGETPEQRRARVEAERQQREEEREAKQRRAQLVGGITGGMKFGAGLAGIQTGMDAIQTGYQGANDINRYTDEFMRRTKDVGNGFDFLRDQITQVGQGLGVASDEAAKLTLAFTRTAHAATLEEAKAGTDAAIGLAAGFGADKGQTVQQMAGMSLIGATKGPLNTRDKQFALFLAQAIGHNNVPLEKAMGDFSRLAESSAARTGNAPPTEAIAGYLKSLYDVAETHQGLKGSSGLSLLQSADEGLKNNNSPAMMMTMFEGLSPLMGTKNFLQILKQKEKGGLAPVTNTDGTPLLNADGTPSNATNISVYLKGMRKNYGNIDPLALAMRANEDLNMGGIERAEQFIKINDTYEGGVTGYKKDLAKHGIEMEKLDTSGIKDVRDILEAKPSEQFDVAKSKLKTDFAKPLSDEERKRLEGLRDEASGGDPAKQQAFISAMIKTSAEHGMMATPYSQMEVTLAQIKDVLIQNIGKPITEGFSLVAAFLQKYFGFTPEQQKAEKEYTTAQQGSRAVHEKANTAIDAAQAEVDNAKTPQERAEADKKLQAVRKQWLPSTEAIRQEKLEKYYQQRGTSQGFIDDFFGFWMPGKSFMDRSNPIGMNESPEEERYSEQSASREQLEKNKKNLKLQLETLPSYPYEDQNRKKQLQEELTTIEQQLADLPPPIRRATGGRIPGGVGGGDRVHALLTPGEFVINAGAAQKNQSLLNQINSGSALDSDSETPATVRDLQKRLEQLFDPVTRYLAELAQGARAMATGRSSNGTPAMTGLPGPGGAGATTADGTPINPSEETNPLIRAALANKKPAAAAYPPVTMPSVHNFTGQTFHGTGMGFMSPGTASARERFEHRSDFVGPLSPDRETNIRNRLEHRADFVGPPLNPKAEQGAVGDASSAGEGMGTPSAKAAREGSVGGSSALSGASSTGTKGLLDAISKAEGTTDANAQKHGYASGYDVTLGYGKFGGKGGEGKPLSQMTVGEVKALQKSMLNHPDNNLNSSAVGKYQVVGKTLRGLQSQMGFKDSDIFSPELQDKIGEQLLKGRGLEKFQKGQISATQFQGNIAKEWASIPHPGTGRATQHTGVSESGIQSAIAASKNTTPVPPPADPQNTPIPKTDNPEYTPKPKEPIPEPTMQQASAGQGIGHLDIVMRQQDAYGATIGQDVNHRMNLRTPRPTGRISVAAVNARTA